MMKFSKSGHIYFTGIELIFYYHYLEMDVTRNKYGSFDKKYRFILFIPKTFLFSQKEDLINFANEHLIKGNGVVTMNTSNDSRFFSELTSRLHNNCTVNVSEIDFKQGLENSLYFLNHQDIEFIYDSDSVKYYNNLFTYENIKDENVLLLGAVSYFNQLYNKSLWS